MSTTGTYNSHRLEGYRTTRGFWRWRVRSPEGIVDQMGLAHFDRGDAMEEGREYLRELGVEEWDEWADGLSEHLLTMRPPRIDPEAEARAAGLTPPPDREEAERVHRELESRRAAALEQAELNRQRPDPEMKQVDEPAGDAELPEAERPTPEKPAPNPISQQRRKSSRAKDVE